MTFAQVMVPGWLMFVGAMVAIVAANTETILVFTLGFWYVVCLIHAFFMIAHGLTSLPGRFRELAAGASK